MNAPLVPDHVAALRSLSVPAALGGGVSRRGFLQAALAGAGGLALAPTLSHLQAFAASPIGPSDGVLVLVTMHGGNDGLNTLVPTFDGNYYARRGSLALQPSQVLALGGGYGLHPSLPRLHARFAAGQVALVQGVGYQPPDLSHFTSMAIWMQAYTGSFPGGVPTGWGGRFLDGLANAASESLLGVHIGTSIPLLMQGQVARASGLPQSLGNVFGLNRSEPHDGRTFDAVAAIGQGATGLGTWGDALATSGTDAIDLGQRIAPAYSGPAAPNTAIARQLVLSARLVNANLGIRVLSTGWGDFDHHDDQPGEHAARMSELDVALDSFFAELSPVFRSRVAVMVSSEFGRTPWRNDSNGTDHGTAGLVVVAGAKVKGGVYGAHPPISSNRWTFQNHTVDFRAVAATMLDTWLGADSQEVLNYTFGNVGFFRSGPGDPSASEIQRRYGVLRGNRGSVGAPLGTSGSG